MISDLNLNLQVWIFYGRDMKVPAPFNTFALIRSATFLRFIGIGGGGKKWKTGCNMDRCCYKVARENDFLVAMNFECNQ